ncbi:MAG TPA: 50S ribosomal protein L14 [Patescibacteria group bacterium]|nr:50S ribosomal protein L14 [Patescibacteria group bacterium]
MIQPQTKLKIIDNTGANIIQCIRVLGSGKRPTATVGDIIVATVKKATPRKEIKKGDVVKAVIVRTKKEIARDNGVYIRFDDNAAVILDGKEPKGNRIFGAVCRELRDKGFQSVISLSPQVL